MICKDCNGTGINKTKTLEARLARRIDYPSSIRCWMCNGNGNDDPNGIYDKDSAK